VAIAVNLLLAISKIVTGILGNSYALVADGLESTTDVVSSLVVWSGLRISAKPPDADHPFGHGKAESIAGVLVSLFLLAAALLIAIQSIREILTPHHLPAWYTLVVLGIVVVTKVSLYKFVFKIGNSLESTSLRSDAWHHRSDAITSLAAFIGISIALVGGKGYESADGWAALIACCVIFYNGIRMLRPAMSEVMDSAVPDVEEAVRSIAENVDGVVAVEKCRIRKSGLGLLMDIHVTVDGNISVREGHGIGHIVKDHLFQSELSIHDVVVHVEPDNM
ncbi:MAG: cation diffusion facilitator family transporter, partial [bacterium]